MALAAPGTASASLVHDNTILAPAQGFGTAPLDLTLQATGSGSFEPGGLAWNGMAIGFGSVLVAGSAWSGSWRVADAAGEVPQSRLEGA